MRAKTGGPAFPVAPGDVLYYEPGMSLRDWFAGQAMNGLLNNPDAMKAFASDALAEGKTIYHFVALAAVDHADALLAALDEAKP